MPKVCKERVICLPDGPVRRRRGLAHEIRRALSLGDAKAATQPLRGSHLNLLRSAGIAVAGLSLSANAPLESGLEQFGQRISDEDLGEMRGKFVSTDDISYFGIEMATSWQNADNITTSAVLLFAVDFISGAGNLEGASPTVAIGWERGCNGCADPAMDVVGFGAESEGKYVAVAPGAQPISVGGLSSVSGAVQSQQLAGDDNRVLNAMQVAVLPASAAMELDQEGLTKISQSTSQAFVDGSSVGFVVGANEIGLSMTSGDGLSAVHQGVNGSPNHAAQHVLLNTNMNTISNTMSISVGLEGPATQGRLQADNAMSAIRSLTP